MPEKETIPKASSSDVNKPNPSNYDSGCVPKAGKFRDFEDIPPGAIYFDGGTTSKTKLPKVDSPRKAT